MKKIIYSLAFALVIQCALNIDNCNAQWTQTNGPQGADIQYIITNSGNILYSDSYSHLYRSYNNGVSWELLYPPTNQPASIFAINSYLYLEDGNGGAYRSDDEGSTWNLIPELGSNLINSIAFYNDSVYISINGGVYISNDNGFTFAFYPVTTGFTLYDELIFGGDYLFTSSLNSGVYSVLRSADFGRTWIKIDSSGTPAGKYAMHYAFGNNVLYGSFFYSGIYKSTDFGIDWTQVLNSPDDYYAVLKYNNGRLYAAYQDSIFVSTNNGNNWTPLSPVNPAHIINDFAVRGNILFAGMYFPGVYRSYNGGNSWILSTNSMRETDVNSLTSLGNYLYASNRGCGLFRTINGNNWQRTSGDLPYDYVTAVFTDSSKLYAGSTTNSQPDGGLFRSTNNGINWSAVYRVDSNYNFAVSVVNAKGSDIMFGTTRDGIYRSTNDGLSWNVLGSSIFGINSIIRLNEWLFYSTHNTHSAPFGSIMRSSDNGLNWESVPVPTLPRPYPAVLEKNNGLLFAIAQSKLFKTTNYGCNWIRYYPTFGDSLFQSIYSFNGILYCGTEETTNGKFYVRYSTDNGVNWNRAGDSLVSRAELFCVKGNYLYAGLYDYGVWRFPLSIITSGNPLSDIIPGKFILHQNYPNPFNPTTRIKFNVAEVRGQMSEVRLIIYDILGREVATLVNEELKPGTYEVEWDASNYASGVYFYRISATEYTETKKMIILK